MDDSQIRSDAVMGQAKMLMILKKTLFIKTILPRQKECKIPSASASGCLPKNRRPNLLAKSQCLRYTITENQVSGCIFMTDKKHEDNCVDDC